MKPSPIGLIRSVPRRIEHGDRSVGVGWSDEHIEIFDRGGAHVRHVSGASDDSVGDPRRLQDSSDLAGDVKEAFGVAVRRRRALST